MSRIIKNDGFCVSDVQMTNEKFQEKMKIDEKGENLKVPEDFNQCCITDEESGTKFIPLTTNPLVKVRFNFTTKE